MDRVASARNSFMRPLPTASASLPRAPASTPAVSSLVRFLVADAMEAKVKAAFRSRPHRVHYAAGFVRMVVLCPLRELELAASEAQ